MPKQSSKTSKTEAVGVERLTVAYDRELVIESISFSVKKGDIVAIIGPNGSGKTTLVKTILGLVKPKSGSVKLLGKHLHEVRDRIGYVPQKFNFDRSFPITVREFLELALHESSEKHLIEETVKEVGLTPQILPKLLGTLSGGQLQRVLIAQAVINKPELLILDEPSTGIDVVGEETFYEIIRHLNEEHDTTVILISHDISMVSSKVDQVICVNKQLLCSGPPKKTLTKATLEKVFGKQGIYEHGHTSHKH